MPHVAGHSGNDSGTDYSSFEYQHVQSQITAEGLGNVAPETSIDFEPLEPFGGLSNDEVAELVAMRIHAFVEHEPEQGGGQETFSETEHRGIVGSDLGEGQFIADSGLEDEQSGTDVVTGGTGQDFTFPDDANTVNVRLNQQVSPEIFASYNAQAGQSFGQDVTNNGSGNASFDNYRDTIMYRDELGRGPILDSTDSLTVNQKIVASDSQVDVRGVVRMNLVWDVAEMDDAGQRFAVPDF